MKKVKTVACLAGALLAAGVASHATAADSAKCKLGKQTYEFKPVDGKKVSLKKLEGLDGRTRSGYTEVEWTYFKSEKTSGAMREAAVTCDSRAFIKIGDIDRKSMKNVAITGVIYHKLP